MKTQTPVGLILDTDMGNDVDDALALAMIHAMQTRGECELLGVALSKDNPFSPVCVDIINTFYNRGDIPIGTVVNGFTQDDGNFIRQIAEARDAGKIRYARTREAGDYPEAVGMMRRIFAGRPDHSVVPVMIGFSTNMARLLDSPPDEHSELDGHALFQQKVSHVVMMAADFSDAAKIDPTPDTIEYNIRKDIRSAQVFIDRCPTPILFSGFEVGTALMYPGADTEHLYGWTTHHPVAEAYRLFLPMPYDRPSWDLTAVLAAVRPQGGYFGLSEPGRVTVENSGIVHFINDPNGRHRHMMVIKNQHQRVIKTMVDLVTQPNKRGTVKITAQLAKPSRRPVNPL